MSFKAYDEKELEIKIGLYVNNGKDMAMSYQKKKQGHVSPGTT